MTEKERNQLKEYIKSVMIYDENNYPITDNLSKEIKDYIIYIKITDKHITQATIQSLYNQVLTDFYKRFKTKIKLKKEDDTMSNSFIINIYQSSIIITALFYYFIRLKIKESTANTKTKCQITKLNPEPDFEIIPRTKKGN